MNLNTRTPLELSVTTFDPEIVLGIQAESVKLIDDIATGSEVISQRGHIRLQPGMRFVIDKENFLIGRSVDNDLCIKDLRISRQHARIGVRADGLPLLHNLSTSNPTTVGGEQVLSDGHQPLHHAGEIQLAGIVNIKFTDDIPTMMLRSIPDELTSSQPVDVLHLAKVGRQFEGDPPVHALSNVDLRLAPGEWLSITGPSGAGKSTLLNIIGCLDRLSSGSYHFDGIDVADLTDRERAGLRSRRIGFIFQSFHLLPHRSVLENVMLAEVYRQQDSTGRRDRALAALDRVGLSHRTDFLPLELSGGQRQRVAIARALIGYPSLLVCDEPTGNLDSKTTDDILDLFATLNDEGLTLVVVTHDEDVAQRAERRVQITDGQLTELTTNDGTDSAGDGSNPNPNYVNGHAHHAMDGSRASSSKQSAKEPAAIKNKYNLRAFFQRLNPSKQKPKTVEYSGITMRDLADEAIAGMFARPGRMVLTMLGIVIGITALIATIGLSRTANNRIITQFDELAATEIFIKGKSTIAGTDPKAIPWDAPSRLQLLNGVVAAGTLSDVDVSGALVSSSLVRDPKTQTAFNLSVQAASSGLFTAVRAELQSGRLLDAGHSERMDKVAVLGPGAAKRLGITSLEHLPAITIGDHIYLVIGILQGVARRPDMLNSVIIPEGTAQRDFGLIGPESVVVETRIGALYLIVKQIPYALRPDDPIRALQLEFPPEPKRLRDAVQSDLNIMILLLGGLSLVVGAIGIGNITLVSVIERTGEIGLRRAIGATRWHIASQFLLESASMGIIGGILGAGIGILIVIAVSAYQTWAPVLDPAAPFLAPVVGGTIGLVSGVYPALRAAQLEPVEAFRN